MNENLDLTQVLKDCPKGAKLYSPILGEVEFCKITDHRCILVMLRGEKHNDLWYFGKDGKSFPYMANGEIMLFPSKDQRDWSKFNPNVKPIFKVGDRIVDTVRNNGHVYEILEVLDGRYRVTGFDTLWFWEQDDFALAPVQIEFIEPSKVYWFVWKEGITEPLLDELMTLSDSEYRPCALKDGEIVFNVADEILVRSHRDTGAMLATMFGTRLSIKEE